MCFKKFKKSNQSGPLKHTHSIPSPTKFYLFSGEVGAYLLDSNFVVNAATETPLNEPPRTQLYSEGIPPATANLRTGDE